MEKLEDQYKSYKALSAHESVLLNAIEGFSSLSHAMIKRLTKWEQTRVTNTLTSLKKKGVITAVKKDCYVITEQIPEHLFAMATQATTPSYISFWTAASYYGITEQQVKTVQVVSTKQYPPLKIKGNTIEVCTVKPQRFYGYKKIEDFAIAEKEKLIIDMLFKLEKSGSITEYKRCLKKVWSEVNQKVLLSYLIRFQNKSIIARMGYLLGVLQLKNTMRKEMKKNLPQGYVLLNPEKKIAKKYDHEWKVIVNDE